MDKPSVYDRATPNHHPIHNSEGAGEEMVDGGAYSHLSVQQIQVPSPPLPPPLPYPHPPTPFYRHHHHHPYPYPLNTHTLIPRIIPPLIS